MTGRLSTGIDFGTTNTVVAIARPGQKPRAITFRDGGESRASSHVSPRHWRKMPGSERETTARRVLRRSIFERGNRVDLPIGCPEHVDWALLKFIWQFDRATWRRIDAARIEQGATVPTCWLWSLREINDFLAALPEWGVSN